MSFIRYFMLRVPQLMLILSVSLPLALVFSAHVSASGFIDAGSFRAIFTGSTAVLWGGLALYTRDTDRRRQLPDVFMTYVNCGNTSVSMKVNEKAEIAWQILQRDALFKKQTRMWWRAVGFVLRRAIVRTPAVLLAAACLVLWFSPVRVVALVADIHSGAATCLVYAAGNILIFAYVLTGAAFALCEMLRRRQGDFICFTQEYQARVREFARAQQKAGEAENADSASRQEGDE